MTPSAPDMVFGPRHPGLNLGRRHPEADDAAEVIVFGFWVFMMSDLIIFGLLMATFVTMLGATAGGPGPAELFDIGSVFAQTMVLLVSSLTFGMASLALKYREDRGLLLFWLGVTLALGIAFLALELKDFAAMAEKGGVPSRSGFLSAFFALVPLHGLHVTVASLWLVVLMVQLVVFGLDTPVKTGLLRLGILWHFLDVVWIGIFSIVYLGTLA
jgi:cytochrome o ubiquinol oxidase subunit 3